MRIWWEETLSAAPRIFDSSLSARRCGLIGRRCKMSTYVRRLRRPAEACTGCADIGPLTPPYQIIREVRNLAERGGFEPPVEFLTLRRFSKPLLSTTQPPLRFYGA